MTGQVTKIFKVIKIENNQCNDKLTNFPLVYKYHEDRVMFVLLSNISLVLQAVLSVYWLSHRISVFSEGWFCAFTIYPKGGLTPSESSDSIISLSSLGGPMFQVIPEWFMEK